MSAYYGAESSRSNEPRPRGKKRIFWDLNPKKSEKIPKIRKNLKIQERFSLVNDMILS
jgi:hypothetical protein